MVRNQKIEVAFRANKDGGQDMAILLRDVNVKPLATGREYWLADIQRECKFTVNCDGHEFKPKLVFKLYCKTPPKMWEQVQHKRALEAARKKSPILC